jgi:hypothetical protein
MTVPEHASNSPSWRKPHRYRGMTLMTAMMMKCKGSLNGVGHSPEMGDGRDHGEHKRDKERCRCEA